MIGLDLMDLPIRCDKLRLLAGAMAAGLMRAAEAWAVNCHHVTSADDLEPLADGLITPRAACSPYCKRRGTLF